MTPVGVWKTLSKKVLIKMLIFVILRVANKLSIKNQEEAIPKRAGHPNFTMVRKGSRVQISKAAPEFRILNRSVLNRADFLLIQTGVSTSP